MVFTRLELNFRIARHSTNVPFLELLCPPTRISSTGRSATMACVSDEFEGLSAHNNPAEGFLRRNDSGEELI